MNIQGCEKRNHEYDEKLLQNLVSKNNSFLPKSFSFPIFLIRSMMRIHMDLEFRQQSFRSVDC